MGGFIAILIIAIAALIRTNMNQARKLKAVKSVNSDYNKLYEENLNLQIKSLDLELENIDIKIKNNNLMISILKQKPNIPGKLPITYSVN